MVPWIMHRKGATLLDERNDESSGGDLMEELHCYLWYFMNV